jgi:hypothetical protein
MKTHHPPHTSHPLRIAGLALAMVTVTALAAVPACGNSNPVPPGTSSSVAGSSGATTGTGGSSTTGSGASTTSGTGGATTSGTGGATTVGTGGNDAGPPCVPDGGATGCYSCPPTTTDEFLNACAANDQCSHFDNTARIPGWDGGPLPVP